MWLGIVGFLVVFVIIGVVGDWLKKHRKVLAEIEEKKAQDTYDKIKARQAK
jgi:heme exporter protein D